MNSILLCFCQLVIGMLIAGYFGHINKRDIFVFDCFNSFDHINICIMFLKLFLGKQSVVFYGDDTWLRLFEPPGEHFLRYDQRSGQRLLRGK